MNDTEIREWLRRLIASGLTIRSISDATGINYTTLWRFIQDKGSMSMKRGSMLLAYLESSGKPSRP